MFLSVGTRKVYENAAMNDEESTLNFEPINHVHSMSDLMCFKICKTKTILKIFFIVVAELIGGIIIIIVITFQSTR